MRTIRDIKFFENIPILVRGALNVPVENGEVTNDYRLRRALPTLGYLRERGARIVLIGHLGEQGTETLAPVASALAKLIPGISFFHETVGDRARAAVRDLSPGQILVMENVRRDKRELRNDPTFAGELAALADTFVQDCFDTCHRSHASIVGIPKLLPSYAGFLLDEEVSELSLSLAPKHPALAVIGGAKFNSKGTVIATLLKKYDRVFVGGAIANDFAQVSGKDVGKSLVSIAPNVPALKKLMANPRLMLPVDSVIVDGAIVDEGPGTQALLADLAQKAKTILWSGPLGKYEDGFNAGTLAFARAVASSHAHSIVGGGDTVAAIEGLGLLPCFSFVSTGGSAMLDFLATGTLPGIAALDNGTT